VPLQADVALPGIHLRPAAGIEAGTTPVGEPVQQSVQLTNTSRVEFVIDSVVVLQVNVGFWLSDTPASRVPPSGSLDITVRFAPVADGAVSGRVAVYSS
jgi:hypothetical protein